MFISPTNDLFEGFNECECTGTQNAKLVSLISKVLVVLDGTTYKVCKFDNYNPTTTSAAMDLTLPTAGFTGTISTFSPFFFKRSSFFLYVLMNDGTDSAIYTYDTSGSTGPLSPTIVGNFFQ